MTRKKLLKTPSPFPEIITTRTALREIVARLRAENQSIGLVPTMGALHAGHTSLVEASNLACDKTIVSIFVNPTQFGPTEDFRQYPRELTADLVTLSPFNVAAVFAPSIEEMYPSEASTFVDPPQVASRWEGTFRPDHFRGVATIVLKLFHLIPADVAFFGEKDFQQLLVLRTMAEDLNLPIEVRGCPTVREPDGLALSSRNAYLSDSQREKSLAIYRALHLAQRLAKEGETDGRVLTALMREALLEAGIEKIDYVAIANRDTLEVIETLDDSAQALIAAFVGKTRLIDNCPIER